MQIRFHALSFRGEGSESPESMKPAAMKKGAVTGMISHSATSAFMDPRLRGDDGGVVVRRSSYDEESIAC